MSTYLPSQFYAMKDSPKLKSISEKFMKTQLGDLTQTYLNVEWKVSFEAERMVHRFFMIGAYCNPHQSTSSTRQIKMKLKSDLILSKFFKYLREEYKISQSEAIDALVMDTLELKE